MELRKVLEKHRDKLMETDGVIGIGEGVLKGKPCLKVFVTRKSPQISRNIPAVIDGYKVSIEETGEFKALR